MKKKPSTSRFRSVRLISSTLGETRVLQEGQKVSVFTGWRKNGKRQLKETYDKVAVQDRIVKLEQTRNFFQKTKLRTSFLIFQSLSQKKKSLISKFRNKKHTTFQQVKLKTFKKDISKFT